MIDTRIDALRNNVISKGFVPLIDQLPPEHTKLKVLTMSGSVFFVYYVTEGYQDGRPHFVLADDDDIMVDEIVRGWCVCETPSEDEEEDEPWLSEMTSNETTSTFSLYCHYPSNIPATERQSNSEKILSPDLVNKFNDKFVGVLTECTDMEINEQLKTDIATVRYTITETVDQNHPTLYIYTVKIEKPTSGGSWFRDWIDYVVGAVILNTVNIRHFII